MLWSVEVESSSTYCQLCEVSHYAKKSWLVVGMKQDASWEMVVALGKVIKWEMVAEGLMRGRRLRNLFG